LKALEDDDKFNSEALNAFWSQWKKFEG